VRFPSARVGFGLSEMVNGVCSEAPPRELMYRKWRRRNRPPQTRIGGRIDIAFAALQGQSYTILYQNDLVPGAPWTTLTNLSSTVTGPLHYQDTLFSPTLTRFYRISTPQSP